MTTAQILDVDHLQNEIALRDQKIVYLEEQLDWFKRQIFGKRSERIVSEIGDQMKFDGFDELEKSSEKQTQTVPAHERRKPKRNGQDAIALPPDLPVQTVVLDVPEEEKICKETGKPLVKIGEEVSLKLAHEPRSYYVKEIIRPKYAYPHRPEAGVLTAQLPDSIIPKCRADESLLAEIAVKNLPIICRSIVLRKECGGSKLASVTNYYRNGWFAEVWLFSLSMIE